MKDKTKAEAIASAFYVDVVYFSSLGAKMNLKTSAAMAAPTNGARMNTQTCESAAPPSKIAGARLLAGLTDVPVRGIPIICTNVSVRPITMPAMFDVFSLAVTPRIAEQQEQFLF